MTKYDYLIVEAGLLGVSYCTWSR